MSRSIKDSISVDVSRAVADALWDEINKPFRQRNMPQLLKDVHDALEEYGDLLDDSDREEFEFWVADVEDDLNSPHIEDSVDFDPEDYESFKVVNKTSLDNKQYAMIQAKAIDQNKPDVFYISSSPDMQPEDTKKIYVTRADAEREFDQIKAKADKRRNDSKTTFQDVGLSEKSEIGVAEINDLIFDPFERGKAARKLYGELYNEIEHGGELVEESEGCKVYEVSGKAYGYEMTLYRIETGEGEPEIEMAVRHTEKEIPFVRLPSEATLKINMKHSNSRLMKESDIRSWSEFEANKELSEFYYALSDRFRELGYANDMDDNGIMSITEEGAGYRITLYYDVRDGDAATIDVLVRELEDGSAEVQDAMEPVDYFVADYKSTKPQNKYEEEVLDKLIRQIIVDSGEDAGSGEWTYIDQGPVQGAIIYTTDIEFKKDENNQFEVIVKKFDVEYDSDY